MDENYCTICYYEMEDNYCQISVCRHRFCRCCIQNIIDKEVPICPLDNGIIESIVNVKINRNNKHYIADEQSIEKYCDSILKDEPKSIIQDIEKLWSDRIMQLNKIYQKLNDIFDSRINQQEIWLKNKSQIDEQNFYMEIKNKLINDLTIMERSEVFRITINEKICLNSAERNSVVPQTLFSVNLLNSKLLRFPVKFEFDYLLNFIDSIFCKENFIETALDDIKNVKKQYKIISKYIINFALSFLNDNKEIFQYLQSDFNKSDFNKCLICTNEISERVFATFYLCKHKICKHCIDQFLISHASCPFDGDKINNLIMIVDKCEYVSNYIKREIENIQNKMIEELEKRNENIVKHLIDNNQLCSQLIEKMELIVKAWKSQNYEPKQLVTMMMDLKEDCEKLYNNGLIRSLYTNVKFNCFSECYNSLKTKLNNAISMLNTIFYVESDYHIFLNRISSMIDKFYQVQIEDILDVMEMYDKISCPISENSEERQISMRNYNEWKARNYEKLESESESEL